MATNKLCSSYSFKKLMSSDKSNQLLIREAIRKIALGRSMERINLAPGGMSGIGTARMIHGYVAKIHDNPSDEEFSDYGGTIDVGEYPDETASAEPVIHKGVLLSAATNSEGGFLIVPALFSDVTIFMDAATRYAWFTAFPPPPPTPTTLMVWGDSSSMLSISKGIVICSSLIWSPAACGRGDSFALCRTAAGSFAGRQKISVFSTRVKPIHFTRRVLSCKKSVAYTV